MLATDVYMCYNANDLHKMGAFYTKWVHFTHKCVHSQLQFLVKEALRRAEKEAMECVNEYDDGNH